MTRRGDDDFAHEIEAHLAIETDRLIAEGMRPEDARHAARRRFGNPTRVRERFYDASGRRWLDDLRADIRHAGRMLRRAPGFAAVAVVTLALAIGANTAIFSVVNAVLLRPLPYADAERLVRPSASRPGQLADGRPRTTSMEPGDFERLRDSADSFSHVIGVLPSTPTLTGAGEATRLDGVRISADAFDMLAARPFLGRTLHPRDDQRGDDNVIVLAHATWIRYFGGEQTAIGRTVDVSGRPTTIVGVMPREFAFPQPRVQFWMPYGPPPPDAFARPIPDVIARLRDGASIEAAESEANALLNGPRSGPRRQVELRSIHADLVAPVKPALVILAAAVGLLLLIACVNVAHLVLARTTLRRSEIAVRLAIGAGRGRLVRQMLTENVVLAAIGGVFGIALAFAALDLLKALATNLARLDVGPGVTLPRLDEISIDWATLTFTATVSVFTAVLFGLAPALHALQTSPMCHLRRDVPRHRFRELLVAAETAMAMILLVGGGLLIHSFAKLATRDTGYDPSQVLTFQAAPRLATPPRARTFSDDLLARLEALPGVRAAGYDNTLPLIRMRFARDVSSRPIAEEERLPGPRPQMHTVSRGLLPALGIRIVEGRTFAAGDAGRGEALVNQAFVRSGILGQNAVGRRLYSSNDGEWNVVGVVNDVMQSGLDAEAPAQIYVLDFVPPPPGSGGTYFAVRTEGAAEDLVPTVRALARGIDPNATITNVATMRELLWHSLARQRLYAVMMGIFAAVSVALAAIGIFGVVAFAAAQRTHEIGIRLALGARPPMVVRLVMRETVRMTAVGIAAGVLGAAISSRYLQGLLFGLTPLDPVTFAAVIALFVSIAALAAYAPASRAATLDPVAALRAD